MADIVAAHPDLEMLESGKCRCKLTGHEMVPNKDVIEVRDRDPAAPTPPPLTLSAHAAPRCAGTPQRQKVQQGQGACSGERVRLCAARAAHRAE